jgi:hypothetical protein
MSEALEKQEFQMPVPGKNHQLIKPFEGKFRATVRIWMGPGEPLVSTGTMNNEFQLSGLYLHQDYVGDASDGPFQNFEGKGYWGYNDTQKRFEGFWIDNASSIMQFEFGQVDASGKIWSMSGELIRPGTPQPMKKRSVITLQDDDHHKMEMYFTMPDAPEMKSMEIDYERVA